MSTTATRRAAEQYTVWVNGERVTPRYTRHTAYARAAELIGPGPVPLNTDVEVRGPRGYRDQVNPSGAPEPGDYTVITSTGAQVAVCERYPDGTCVVALFGSGERVTVRRSELGPRR